MTAPNKSQVVSQDQTHALAHCQNQCHSMNKALIAERAQNKKLRTYLQQIMQQQHFQKEKNERSLQAQSQQLKELQIQYQRLEQSCLMLEEQNRQLQIASQKLKSRNIALRRELKDKQSIDQPEATSVLFTLRKWLRECEKKTLNCLGVNNALSKA